MCLPGGHVLAGGSCSQSSRCPASLWHPPAPKGEILGHSLTWLKQLQVGCTLSLPRLGEFGEFPTTEHAPGHRLFLHLCCSGPGPAVHPWRHSQAPPHRIPAQNPPKDSQTPTQPWIHTATVPCLSCTRLKKPSWQRCWLPSPPPPVPPSSFLVFLRTRLTAVTSWGAPVSSRLLG